MHYTKPTSKIWQGTLPGRSIRFFVFTYYYVIIDYTLSGDGEDKQYLEAMRNTVYCQHVNVNNVSSFINFLI